MVRRITLSLLFAGVVSVAPSVTRANPSYQTYLERSLKVEAELAKYPEKLKFRHNSEKSIRLWQLSLKKAKTFAEKRQATEGLVAAWKRLSHWSGTSRDKAEADRQQRKLDRFLSKNSKPSGKTKKIAVRRAKATKPAAKARTKPAAKSTIKPAVRSAAAKSASKPLSRPSAQKQPHLLSGLKVEVVEEEVHVILGVKHEVAARRHHIPAKAHRGHRVYFDVSPMVASVAALKSFVIEHAAVKKLRVGQFDADTVRFVFDVEVGQKLPGLLDFASGPSPRFVLAHNRRPVLPAVVAQQRALEKLVEDLKRADKKISAKNTRSQSKHSKGNPTKKSNSTKKKAKFKSLPKVSKKGLNSTTIRAIAPRRSSELTQVRRVVIDPGHGGKDHGATCSKNHREKDVNLAIAKKLGRRLKKEMGVEVIYTRTTDTFVSLKRRAQIANRSKADLFISIHANANANHKVKGIETYYLNTTADEYANRLARRENTSGPTQIPVKGLEPGVGIPAGDDARVPPGRIGRDLSLLLADLAMKSATEESRRLAGYIQSSVVNNLRKDYKNVRDLGVKKALFYVLLGVRMPSVLVESGFMSNPMEAKRLTTGKYQDRLAESIAQGLQRFVLERRQLARKL